MQHENWGQGSRAVGRATPTNSYLNIHANKKWKLNPANCSQVTRTPTEKAVTTESPGLSL